MAEAGADVAVCGRNSRDLDRVSNDIIDLGRDAAEFPLDVTSKEMVAEGVEKILDRFGKVDILVNNSGVNHGVPILEFTEEAWDRVQDTKLKGYFLVARSEKKTTMN